MSTSPISSSTRFSIPSFQPDTLWLVAKVALAALVVGGLLWKAYTSLAGRATHTPTKEEPKQLEPTAVVTPQIDPAHPADQIHPRAKEILNNLLGKEGPVDNLPVYTLEEGEIYPTAAKMTHPVMVCIVKSAYTDTMPTVPCIAIKVRYSSSKKEAIQKELGMLEGSSLKQAATKLVESCMSSAIYLYAQDSLLGKASETWEQHKEDSKAFYPLFFSAPNIIDYPISAIGEHRIRFRAVQNLLEGAPSYDINGRLWELDN